MYINLPAFAKILFTLKVSQLSPGWACLMIRLLILALLMHGGQWHKFLFNSIHVSGTISTASSSLNSVITHILCVQWNTLSIGKTMHLNSVIILFNLSPFHSARACSRPRAQVPSSSRAARLSMWKHCFYAALASSANLRAARACAGPIVPR